MRIIGLIPARKNSKRLKNKNIYPLKGKPLIQYTIDAALKSGLSELYVSSDSDKILKVASDNGVKTIKRPEELSGDITWTQDVVNHMDDTLGDLNDEDIIVILQANSPQMTSDKIDECVNFLIDKDLWQVNTVDDEFINNGAIQVIKRKVRHHNGKVNYNGVVQTDWIDVHYKEDIDKLEEIL
jgi:CMP-N-acetylneuraminic acid synthetase